MLSSKVVGSRLHDILHNPVDEGIDEADPNSGRGRPAAPRRPPLRYSRFNSTRRFCALPWASSLPAMGCSSPKPASDHVVAIDTWLAR